MLAFLLELRVVRVRKGVAARQKVGLPPSQAGGYMKTRSEGKTAGNHQITIKDSSGTSQP